MTATKADVLRRLGDLVARARGLNSVPGWTFMRELEQLEDDLAAVERQHADTVDQFMAAQLLKHNAAVIVPDSRGLTGQWGRGRNGHRTRAVGT